MARKKRHALSPSVGRRPKRSVRSAADPGASHTYAPGAHLAFPVVGIGASAGGLEAFTQLLRALPSDTGMAFVLIQHLDPEHESAMLKSPGDDPIRCWVLGCSTGQEAYSIAMAFVETADKAPHPRRLQVFATDLNDALLDKARHGLYAKSLIEDITPERLRRFFVEEDGGYPHLEDARSASCHV